MERNYQLEVGDVVLVECGGWGIDPDNEGKYIEVTVVGDKGVDGKEYDQPLIGAENGKVFDVWYETFGSKPLILLNTKEDYVAPAPTEELVKLLSVEGEYTGSSSNYYKVYVKHPTTLPDPYEAECNDIIESLNMTFAEGNAFKAIWRKAKARQGVKKKGYDNGVYDSEKVVFFGERMLIEAKDSD